MSLVSRPTPRAWRAFTTPFLGLAPDPDAERLDSDAECRKNIGEELHSHFNYERDILAADRLPPATVYLIWM